MRKCANCGKISENNNDINCISCGGILVAADMTTCRNCGAQNDSDAEFCRNCGSAINAVPEMPPIMPGAGVYLRESVDSESKGKNKTLIIAIAAIVSVCILAGAIVFAAVLLNDDDEYVSEKEESSDSEDKNKKDKKDAEDDSSENGEEDEDKKNDESEDESDDEAEEEKDSESEKEEESEESKSFDEEIEVDDQKTEEESKKSEEKAEKEKVIEKITPKDTEVPSSQRDDKVVSDTIKQQDFVKLENAVDNYVYSFVTALNNRDSSYMLPYTMSGSSSSNVYNTQTKFIHSGKYEYEEYIDSYIIGEASYENSNTCVISVYEIYNVMKTGEDWKRHEQTVKYRMKRDSYGDWKVYEFVGSVKTH